MSTTLADIIREKTADHAHGVTFIQAGDKELFISYARLYADACKVLFALQQRGIQPGNELVLQAEDQPSFVRIFWACILGGIIPVPLSPVPKEEHKRKLFNIWPILNRPYLITNASHLEKLQAFASDNDCQTLFLNMAANFIDVATAESSVEAGVCRVPDKDDIAFIQFSSGSTGAPKGVTLTHENILTTVRDISEAAGYSAADAFLSWMPLTHDMGLIGFHINPLFAGVDQYLIPTDLFVRRPALWLEKASTHGISILCSPNFGYRYFLRHCGDIDKSGWDLSSVRLIYNGAEPISAALCGEFSRSLEKTGLTHNAIRPVYGLAEASLAVSISTPGEEVISIELDAAQMNIGDSVSLSSAASYTMEVVNVGKPVAHCAVRIADRNKKKMGENEIGLIQIKGPAVTPGYYNNKQATEETLLPGGWLDTGDVGFLRNGNLYVVGRDKDILFSNGQNYYPHDIEKMAERMAGIELNKMAVAGFFNASRQKEEAVAFVLHRGSGEQFVPVYKKVKQIIGAETGLELDKVIPVSDIPRTTSGKIQRFRLLQQYREGQFDAAVAELEQLLEQPSEDNSVPGKLSRMEEKVAKVWELVLERAVTRGDEDFFELGGNSLKAAELRMQLLKEFQVDLPFEVLYQNQTVKTLAGIIERAGRTEYIPIPVSGGQDWRPIASSQRRIYYAWQMDKQSVAYNIPVAFTVQGKIDTERMQAVIVELIKRHDSLRMVFDDSGNALFKVLAEVPFLLDRMRVSGGQWRETLKTLVRPFDLSRGPLFRMTLVDMDDHSCILFADFHHIISDGISVNRFFSELIKLYEREQLAALPVTYRDYACWEQGPGQAGKYELNEQYWQSQVADELPVLEMPLDLQRPAVFSSPGEKLPFSFTEEESMKLRELAQRNGCTLHVVMLTMYQLLLSIYTGQRDIVVGIPVSGRTHPDLQHIQGMFVNNLAIRSLVEEKDTFKTYLDKVNKIVMEALSHQEYPFDRLVTHWGGGRDSSRNPLFDTMFLFHHDETSVWRAVDFTLTNCFFDPGFAKFDLSLEVADGGDRLSFYLEFATGLFRKETIDQLAHHYKTLCRSIVLHPQAAISQLEVLTKEEYQQYVYAFNDTYRESAKPDVVYGLFEQQAKQCPGECAIEYGGRQVSYDVLNEQAGLIADILRANGLEKGNVVCILLPRSPLLVASLLGIMKAGGVFLMIETDFPAERVRHLIASSRSSVVISVRSFEEVVRHGNDSMAFIDADSLTRPPVAAFQPEQAVSADDGAYLIYTSGTTGNSKGALISHGALTNYICWAARQYVKDGMGDFPFFTSVAFDLTITSIFTPLVAGNRIVIYEGSNREVLVERVVRDNKTAVIKLTPSHLRLLRETLTPECLSKSAIRCFVIGGEILEAKLARDIFHLFGGRVELYNEYGPAEATVGCMIHRYEERESYANVPIGAPADNTQIYILDRFLRPVPAGVTGELYISGAGVAREYIYNALLTSERFLKNRFIPGSTMYKTGDLARRYRNGLIDCIGRADKQVKINGHRIELMEIESCLASHPAISDAIAIADEKVTGNKVLRAFYKIKAGQQDVFQPLELRNYLAERLPYYMIPFRLTKVDAIPVTNNGKIDYGVLAGLSTDEPAFAPAEEQSETERRLLKVWVEVLAKAEITTTDHFSEIGGDSIKAVQIAAKLYGEGIVLSVKDLLVYQTIRQISRFARLAAAGDVHYAQGLVEGKKDLSPIESWFFAQRFNNPGWFNQSLLLRWKKPVNKGRLEEAIRMLVAHHDGLRLNYDPQENKLFYNKEHIYNAFVLEEKWLDDPEPALAGNVFDLERTLLLKACLIHLPTEDVLLLVAHHLVIDGFSWRVLLEDLFTVYTALEKGGIPHLPLKTIALSEWQKALAASITSGKWEKEMSYWRAAENTSFSLPLDFDNCHWTMENMGKISGKLEVAFTETLVKGAFKVFNADVQILLGTALVMALKEWTGLDEYLVEWEGHGRQLDDADASRTLGWFTSLFPIKLQFYHLGISQLIKKTKETLRTVPAGGMGYGIFRYSADSRPAGKALQEIPDIRFNYLGRLDQEFSNELFDVAITDTRFNIDPANRMTAKLECNVFLIDNSLRLDIYYNTTAHKFSTIKHFMESFEESLGSIAEYIGSEDDVYLTPSDFEGLKIGQDELDSLFE